MSDPGDAPAHERLAAPGAPRLLDIAKVAAVTTPGFIHIQRRPELHAWAGDLVRFGECDELRPLAPALRHVVANISAGRDFPHLIEALTQESSAVDLWTLVQAGAVCEGAATDAPYASYMLAWTALCLWIIGAQRRDEQLYDRPGLPHQGWGRIPAACAEAAVRLKGLYGSRLLAEEAHAVLQTYWRRSMGAEGALIPDIGRYRRIVQTIAAQEDMAIASLADELREACRSGANSTRSLVAALLWSFGLIPECWALQANPTPPSRRLLRRLIQGSLQLTRDDPLIQYIWLEIKDDAGINLRVHESLLAVFNHRWGQWWIDDEYPMLGLNAEPSRLYARTLTALLGGKLKEADAVEYLEAYDLIVDCRLRLPPNGFVLHRLHMLRHLICERFGYYRPEFTVEQHVRVLKEEIEGIGLKRAHAARQPECPDVLGRFSHASFELIECCLADNAQPDRSERDRCMLVLETLERLRTGALAYWLQVNPPLLPVVDDGKLRDLLREEQELLERLRGAYFVALLPTLPLHYQWLDIRLDVLTAMHEDVARRTLTYLPDVARREMDEIERALGEVAERLQRHVPEYADRRRTPSADLERLVTILNSHAVGDRCD
jgi:hypothetical protein